VSASVRIHNDGPDAVVVRAGTFERQLACGAEMRMVVSSPLSFQPVRPLTPEEAALHGVALPQPQRDDPYAEDG
jgi:hypothetical protein